MTIDDDRMRERLVIDARFSGFPDVALGGYAAGSVAAGLGPAEVRFHRPVPTGVPLVVTRSAEGAALLQDETLLAVARAIADVGVEAPPPIAIDAAREAGAAYPGHVRHLFPGCFCCGVQRTENDGLCVFVGPLKGVDGVAGLWTAPSGFADARGEMPPEVVWSAIDCPGIWALILAAPPDSAERVVTGTLAVKVFRPLRAGVGYVVRAWPLGREGRRLFVGTAILEPEGALAVIAKQTCVITDRGAPLGRAYWE